MATLPEIAYAAGIFDGEGTIDMKDRVRMAVKMTDIEPVMAMQEILGGHFYQWKDQKSGRPTYEWRAAGWDGVMEAIDQIYDFSRGKRRQLQVVGNWYDYKERHGPNADAKRAASYQLRALRAPGALQPLTFDIETMGLDSSVYPVLSCSYVVGDDETSTFSHWKTGVDDEKRLLVQVRETLEAAPYTIGFNSLRFDIPYIQNRLQYHGERPMFLGSHDDASVIYDSQRGNRKRTSLLNCAKELGVADENTFKTKIDWDKWHAAHAGDMGEDGMAYVVDHAEKDILLTKRVYNGTIGVIL